jgi:zinc protease
MPIRLLSLLLLLLLLPAALPAAPPAPAGDSGWLYRGSDIAPDPAWRFGTLANGVRWAVRRNARPEGQVSIRVRIDAGAFHEQDHEQGWAHLTEHLLFRGTASYADRQARHIWQQLGASFGSDSNATTGPTQTVYQLDLPRNDRASLDTSLHVLAEMMSAATFDPAAVEAEKRIVIAEKERRSALARRMSEVSRPLFWAGLRLADRDTIGTEATLGAATADGLRAFWRRWYRPERATVVMVGDADPDMMEALIAARFGGWQGEGPPPTEPDLGAIADPPARAAVMDHEGAPFSLTLLWLRPAERLPHTRARERLFLEEGLAARILNRRLEAHARGGTAAFLSAGIGGSRNRSLADTTQMAVNARDGRWREGLAEAYAIVSDALRAPPSAEEIARELTNMRTAVDAAVEGEPTVLSQVRAQQLIGAIDAGAVVTNAATVRDTFLANAAEMTPERIGAAMRALFTGTPPRLLLLAPTPVEGGAEALLAALEAAERAAPAVRRAERSVRFEDLPALGAPGREIARERIEDLDVTIVRFENGATLTFKRTEFERGSVGVRLRFGRGMAGLAPDRPSLAWMGGLVAPSGLADLDLDALERMLTGRRIALSFDIAEDGFILSGQTNSADLGDQMRLLATKLAHPRWDADLFARFQASALETWPLQFASASARGSREFPGLVRPGDARWRPLAREEIAAATPAQFEAWFSPLLAAGPVHATVVGETDLETAVAAAARSIGALPVRPEAPAAPGSGRLSPPTPNPEPTRFTHDGDPAQAYALIGWSTLGGLNQARTRRALALAANLLQVRLFDRLREELGATYSPSAAHSSSVNFTDWGIFFAAAEVRPENADAFFRIAREVVAELAARPVDADEFARAQTPAIRGIERRMESNAYWLGAIENFAWRPQEVAVVRSWLSDYREMTAEEVRAALSAHVVDAGDWSMLVLPARGGTGTAPNGQ